MRIIRIIVLVAVMALPLLAGGMLNELPGNQNHEWEQHHVTIPKSASTVYSFIEMAGDSFAIESNELFQAAPAVSIVTQKDPDQKIGLQNNIILPEASAARPVSYIWGEPLRLGFRSEVIIINNGKVVAENIRVDLPLLESSSPYQETLLQATSDHIVSTTGQLATFGIGDLQPGETRIISCDYSITILPVSISFTSETVEKARQAYQEYAGSGNCLALATAFVNRCEEMGLTARVVYGYAMPERSEIITGPLAGNRHSWAEFYLEGLGWVPVDLTFEYFGDLSHASHVIETYVDQSLKVYHLGGILEVSWQNSIF